MVEAMNEYDRMCADEPYPWNGPHGKGAMRNHRNSKRLDAISRNAAYQERGRIPADPRYRKDPLNS